MTRLRAADRDRILDNAYETLARIRAYRQGITTLRDAIASRMNDGMRAATYDDSPSAGDGTSPTERAALLKGGDRAHDDLARLDVLLARLADIDSELAPMLARYPVWSGKPSEQKPGEGPCPVGLCKTCWDNTRREMHDDRYKDFCRWCGDWKAQHGQKPPKAIWRIHHEQGKRITTGDLRKHAPHLMPKSA